MGFLDSVNDNSTKLPTKADYLDLQSEFAFTAKVLDVKVYESQNKKNNKVCGREFFIVEMEVLSGDASANDRAAEPGDVLTFSKMLPATAKASNAGYVISEVADILAGISGRPRSEFRGGAEHTAQVIQEIIASGECIDKACFVSATDPNEKGYRLPVFEVVEAAPAKSTKKAS